MHKISFLLPLSGIHPGWKLIPVLTGFIISLADSSLLAGSLIASLMILSLVISGVKTNTILVISGLFLTFFIPGIIPVLFHFDSSGLAIHPDGSDQFLKIFSRTAGCSFSLIFLMLTMPAWDFVLLMQRMKFPHALTDLTDNLLRYIFLIWDYGERNLNSQISRNGFLTRKSKISGIKLLGSSVFMRSLTLADSISKSEQLRGKSENPTFLHIWRTPSLNQKVGLLVLFAVEIAIGRFF